MMLSTEYAGREGRDPSAIGATADDLAHAYDRRWSMLREAKAALDVELLEAEALWEDVLAPARNKLELCLSSLSASLTLYVRAKRDLEAGQPAAAGTIQRYERVIYPMGTEEHPDEFADSLRETIQEFEAELRPHLKR